MVCFLDLFSTRIVRDCARNLGNFLFLNTQTLIHSSSQVSKNAEICIYPHSCDSIYVMPMRPVSQLWRNISMNKHLKNQKLFCSNMTGINISNNYKYVEDLFASVYLVIVYMKSCYGMQWRLSRILHPV